MIDWFAKSSMWRGGSTFAGHVNNIFDATIDALDEQEKQAAYAAAPLFAPLSVEELASRAEAGGTRRQGRRPAGVAPPGAPGAPGAPGGGRGARGGPPATARNVPLDRQERYDNLVFPRGGGPGSLAGRGGAPNPAAGAQVFREVCAECHRFGTIGKEYAPELTRANTMLRRDILRSIFFPSEKVDELYETTVLSLARRQDASRARDERERAECRAEDCRNSGPGRGTKGTDSETGEREDLDHAGQSGGQGGRWRGARRDRLPAGRTRKIATRNYKLSHKQRERAEASEPGERRGAPGSPRASQ